MTVPVLDPDSYCKRLVERPRPGLADVLSFYDDAVGAVCKDGRFMVIPLDDHLVHRGDGVFETLKYLDGKMYQLDAHLDRMKRSAAAIFLEPPRPWDEVRRLTLDVAKAGGEPNGLVRILLGRGPGGFGIDPFECPTPSLYIVCYGFHKKAESVFEKGVTAVKTSIPAKQSWMAKIKSIDYLPNMLMKREAVVKKADFPICFDEHGFMAEGATENAAIVDESGTLVIPELNNALTGTTLMRAVDLVKSEIPITFRGITEPEIYAAREFMVIGTTIDALAIVRYNDKPIHDQRPGPVAKRIRELLQQDLVANGVPVGV